MDNIATTVYSFLDELERKSKKILIFSILYPILIVGGFLLILFIIANLSIFASIFLLIPIFIFIFILLPFAFLSAIIYIFLKISLSKWLTIKWLNLDNLLLSISLILGLILTLFTSHFFIFPNLMSNFFNLFLSVSLIFIVYYFIPYYSLTYYSYKRPNNIIDIIVGAREINIENEKEKLTYEIFDNIRIAHGIPPNQVKLKVVPWDIINAFVVSSADMSIVYVTEKAISSLDYHELESLFAHEFSHIKNRDSYYFSAISISSQISVLVGWLFKVVFTSMFLTGKRRNYLLALLCFILGSILTISTPFIFRRLISNLSKTREKIADTSAVLTTKYPPAFISLLVKVGKEDTSKFVKEKNLPFNFQTLLFDYESETHPKIWERIEYICNLTTTNIPEEYYVFKEKNI